MSGVKRNTIILGITGGIACGKSEVAKVLEQIGFAVCDADQIAHKHMVKGTSVYRRIVDEFGEQILAPTGEISRERLGHIVFENPDRRLLLNSLVHPAVRTELEHWIRERRKRGEDAAVQIPLLFESGMEDLGWDGIICVSSGEEQVIARLRERGVEDQDGRKRIAAQMALEEKEKLSDRVIHNSGTLQELDRKVRETVESLSAER